MSLGLIMLLPITYLFYFLYCFNPSCHPGSTQTLVSSNEAFLWRHVKSTQDEIMATKPQAFSSDTYWFLIVQIIPSRLHTSFDSPNSPLPKGLQNLLSSMFLYASKGRFVGSSGPLLVYHQDCTTNPMPDLKKESDPQGCCKMHDNSGNHFLEIVECAHNAQL